MEEKGIVDNVEDYVKNISTFLWKKYSDFQKVGVPRNTSTKLIKEKQERLKELKKLEKK